MSSQRRLSRPSSITNAYLQNLLSEKIGVPKFRGVFPCDLLPRRIASGDSLILNTDPHYEPGRHYVALFRKDGKTFYFDSLALDPSLAFPTMYENLTESRLTPLIPILPGPIQAPDSRLCGLFCANYVLSRAFQNPKKLKSYSLTSLSDNDRICLSNLQRRIRNT